MSRQGRQLPNAPRTDPGVRYYRTGLFSETRFRILSAIPRSEVCIVLSGLTIRLMFPLQTTFHCQPLPHVASSPYLRVLWVDPTPIPPLDNLLSLASPTFNELPLLHRSLRSDKGLPSSWRFSSCTPHLQTPAAPPESRPFAIPLYWLLTFGQHRRLLYYS